MQIHRPAALRTARALAELLHEAMAPVPELPVVTEADSNVVPVDFRRAARLRPVLEVSPEGATVLEFGWAAWAESARG